MRKAPGQHPRGTRTQQFILIAAGQLAVAAFRESAKVWINAQSLDEFKILT
jgi:hypothetical protein